MNTNNQNTIKRNANDLVLELDNEQLRSLLKEIKQIGGLDAPRYAKQSYDMKKLFDSEKEHYYTWADQYSNVQRAIQIEILHRVMTDTW